MDLTSRATTRVSIPRTTAKAKRSERYDEPRHDEVGEYGRGKMKYGNCWG